LITSLCVLDRTRLLRPWAKDASKALYVSTPAICKIVDIVNDAVALDTGVGGTEDEWILDVQKPLLKLALATSRHADALSLHLV
jgi:hypothetical protein